MDNQMFWYTLLRLTSVIAPLLLLVATLFDRPKKIWHKALRLVGISITIVVIGMGLLVFSPWFMENHQTQRIAFFFMILGLTQFIAALMFAIGYLGRMLESRNTAQRRPGVFSSEPKEEPWN